ncbi:40-residue YVTN family beta-propeller repeat-containing protein [Roseibium suaedae]|uniref:40-residue YVTN family beta-propeller repeat-containing protein n=2 Tax=Roseibium suaedae TaxID=735517 RepID=A0A1M7PPI1_9HYPH|nr:40-residue YVTN family beta-propeller repeat-containing protein [Roseibium suaedae]
MRSRTVLRRSDRSKGLSAGMAVLLALPGLMTCAPAHAGAFAFVTNQNSSDLSVLDLGARTEIRRVPVPGKPAGVAVTPSLGSFFTVSPDSKTLRRFSLATCTETASLQLPGGPTGIAVAAKVEQESGEQAPKSLIFVSDWYNARLHVVDAASFRLIRELETGSAPAGIAVAADQSWVASADRDANQVSFFSLPDLDPIGQVPVGERPYGLATAPDGRLHVANVGSNSVSVIDPGRLAVIAEVPVGERPYGVAFASGRAFVTDQYADTLSIYGLADLKPETVLDVGEYPEGIQATPTGDLIVSTNWFSNTVSLTDPKSLEVTGEIETGDGPRAFGQFIAEFPEGDTPCRASN